VRRRFVKPVRFDAITAVKTDYDMDEGYTWTRVDEKHEGRITARKELPTWKILDPQVRMLNGAQHLAGQDQ
jgi:hypothetical protein